MADEVAVAEVLLSKSVRSGRFCETAVPGCPFGALGIPPAQTLLNTPLELPVANRSLASRLDSSSVVCVCRVISGRS